MENIWKVKSIKLQNTGLGLSGYFGNKVLPDSGGQPEPTPEKIQQYKQNSEKIVSTIVKKSLKEHPSDVLHGSRNLAMQISMFGRTPRDWDIYSTTEHKRARQIESKIDKKAKCDISQTIIKKLPQTGSRPLFGEADKIYMVITPTIPGDTEVDLMRRPKGIRTVRKQGITLLSLDDEYLHKQKSMSQPMRMAKASKDIRYIKQQFKKEGREVPELEKRSFGFNLANPDSFMIKKLKKKPKKELTWSNAKLLNPNLNPWKDSDKDKVPNFVDCKPFDFSRQGILHNAGTWLYDRMSGGVNEAWTKVKQKVEDRKVKSKEKKKYIMVRDNIGEWASAGEYDPEKYNRWASDKEMKGVEVSEDPNWYRVLNRRETIKKIPQNVIKATDKVTEFQKERGLRETSVSGFTNMKEGGTGANIKEGLAITKEGQKAIKSYNVMQAQSSFPPRTKGVWRPPEKSPEEAMIEQIMRRGTPSEKLQAMQYLRQRQSIPRQVPVEAIQVEEQPEMVQNPSQVDTFRQLREEEAIRMATAGPKLPPIGIDPRTGEVRRVPQYSPVSLKQSFLIKPTARNPPLMKQPWGQSREKGSLPPSVIFKPARFRFVTIGGRTTNEENEVQ